MIILDTNVLSEMMRPAPHPAVHRWLADTIHDATFITHPQLHQPAKVAYFRWMLGRAARASQRVVTDSRLEPAGHKKFVEAEMVRWSRIIKDSGETAE